jgi:hypothetical protein
LSSARQVEAALRDDISQHFIAARRDVAERGEIAVRSASQMGRRSMKITGPSVNDTRNGLDEIQAIRCIMPATSFARQFRALMGK